MSQLNGIEFYFSQKCSELGNKNCFLQTISDNTILEEDTMRDLYEEGKDNEDGGAELGDYFEDEYKMHLTKSGVINENEKKKLKNQSVFINLLKEKSNENFSYIYVPTASSTSSTDIQNDANWSDTEEEFRCLQENVQVRYKKMWKECQRLARDNCVFLYAIPAFKRNGKPNQQWRGCELMYYNREEERWTRKEMIYLWNDLINEDSVFRCLLPKHISPTIFFLQDQYSEDRDHPHGKFGEKERNFDLDGNYYHLDNNYIIALRDGEMTQGNKLLSLGISIHFEESICKDSEWYGCVFHYLQCSDGNWYDKHFNKYGFVFLLECRSTTFVIRNRNSTKWLRSIGEVDFHISFPGAYVVYTDGKIIECSFSHLNKLNFVSNNCCKDVYNNTSNNSINTKKFNLIHCICKEVTQNKTVNVGAHEQREINNKQIFMDFYNKTLENGVFCSDENDSITKSKKNKSQSPEVYSINTPPAERADQICQKNSSFHFLTNSTVLPSL